MRIELIFLGFLLCATRHSAYAATQNDAISVSWTATQPTTVIKVFGPEELRKLKKAGSTEADPSTGKKDRYEGVLLADLVEQSLNGMANDRKAQIDLVILKNPQGTEALIPRSFIVKYPVVLARSEDGKPLEGFKSIVPWTSKPKTRSEGLPLETYFVSGVTDVELANYQERYQGIFLKRRTDPLAMRGEKIFVQSCLSCHDSGQGMDKARQWSGQHPAVNGSPKFDSREQRALQSYLSLYKAEK